MTDPLLPIPEPWWTMCTIGFGAALGYAGQVVSTFIQRRADKRSTAFCVATELRTWIEKTRGEIHDTELWISSEGHAGKDTHKVSQLPFEESLERVSRLSIEEAKAVVGLMHRGRAVNAAVITSAEFDGADEAEEEYFSGASQLCLDANKVYGTLAKVAKLESTVLTTEQTDWLRSTIERTKRAERTSTVRDTIPA